MCSYHFDSLKAEKAEAIRRFNRRKNLTSSIKLVGAFFLFLYAYTTLIKLLSPFTKTTATSSQHFYTFLLMNLIVFLIYKSSVTKAPATSHGGGAAEYQPDVHDEYVSHRPEAITRTACDDGYGSQLVNLPPAPEEESSSEEEEVGGLCKDLEVLDNAVEFTNPVRDVGVVDDYDEAVRSEGRCLRRSWSEKGSGAGDVGKVVLRRSETVKGGRKSVEEMDNEEFNMEIEKFIANKRKILREELLSTVEEKDHI